MHRISAFLFFIAIAFLSPAQALTPFTASYHIAFGFVNLGDAQMTFKRIADNTYQLRIYAETSGFTALVYPYSLQERSVLQRLPDGSLRSANYFYEERKDNNIEKQYKVSVDYNKKTIQSLALNKTRQWELTSELPTDKLSFAFIIGDDIEQNKKLRSPITIIDGSKIRVIEIKELRGDPYDSYQNNNNEHTFKRDNHKQYRRFFLEDDGESMEIWLAKKQKHIPYKILFTSDGWTLHYELNQVHWLN